MLPAIVQAVVEAQAGVARQAEEDVRAAAMAEIAARRAANAGRPKRTTQVLEADMRAEVGNFRPGSTVRLKIHRPVHLICHKEGQDRGDPAECQPCDRDEIVECPINPDSVANQTSREMAAMKLKGWFEPAA